MEMLVLRNLQTDNNTIYLQGTIVGDVEYSHEIYGELFFTVYIKCKRMSGTYDILPVTMPENILSTIKKMNDCEYKVMGQIRSYNRYQNGLNKLMIRIFTRQVQVGSDSDSGLNSVQLDGFVCKEPNYRTTPFMREICDMLIAVNRQHKKSDYIPVISWGQNARYARNIKVGQRVYITGRLQSRLYTKRLETGNSIDRTTYEVSAIKLEVYNDYDAKY